MLETLKPSGMKTGRIKVDDLTEINKIFLKKYWFFFLEDTGHEQTWSQTRIYRVFQKFVDTFLIQINDSFL